MFVAALAATVTLHAAAPFAVTVSIEGPLETSLARAIGAQGSALSAQVARLLRWRGDPARNLHRGDVATVIYEPSESPELVALAYRGLEVSLRAYRFTDEAGVPRFYDEAGVLVEPVVDNSPVPQAVQITELVQSGRGKRHHNGMDFKAPVGTPVRLPFAGVVTRVNWTTRTNGNCVEVAIPGGRLVRFLHLNAIDKAVRPGATLAQGAAIGQVGNTGRSSAPHLHYEIRGPDGEPLAPERIHGTSVGRVEPALSARFERERVTYDRRVPELDGAAIARSAGVSSAAGH